MVNSLDDVLWRLLKCECNLDDQHVQMAKRLGIVPEHLAECDHEQLKLHLKTWIKLAHSKMFGGDRTIRSSPN